MNAAYATKPAAAKGEVHAEAASAARAQAGANPLWRAMSFGVQPKLAVSMPGDPFEIEADRVADRVMRSESAGVALSSPLRVHRKCAACAAGGAPCPKCEEEELVQRRHDGRTAAGDVDDGFATNLTGGVALAGADRQFYEARMGYDFGDVRIHTGAAADDSARHIGARAFTLGRDVAFAHGEYQPASAGGRHLLAHELTHVVQQRSMARGVQRSPGPHEAEIERSRKSPGKVAGLASPPSFSLYNFAINSSELKSKHYDFLDELADLVVSGVIKNVQLHGHADSTGDVAINGPLSNDRAMSVEAYLSVLGVSVAGVSSSGSKTPVASNGTEAGRSRNRRVDITFDVVPIPVPIPVPDDDDNPPVPPDDTKPPEPDWPDWPGLPDFPNFCADHPVICGAGLFCIIFPEICAMAIPWPHIPWPSWPGGDDPDPHEPEEPEEPEEPDELNCGDPTLPVTHVDFIPPAGDKGNRMVAEPLTRCQGNTVGSEAKRSDPAWPTGWECIVAAHQSHLWARAHLLHGPTLHGPGNLRQNIIIADKSINKQMSDQVELDAIGRVQHDEVLWYEVDVNHMPGDYPRPYFAESVHMAYGTLDPVTRVRSGAIFDDTIESGTHRVPPDCPSSTPGDDDDTEPPDDTVPTVPDTPTPDDDTHGPSDTTPCDRAELARRVDACVDQAGEEAIDCTLRALPMGGWGGVGEGIEYLLCLRRMREQLLECDRQAKADTHCPDAEAPIPPPGPERPGESFDSTVSICRRLLNSRNFNVSHGKLEVDLEADWLDATSGAPADPAVCPMTEYHVSLEKVGLVFNSEIGTGEVNVGKATRLTWSTLGAGEYFLKIWTNNDNPNCCLSGTITVRAF